MELVLSFHLFIPRIKFRSSGLTARLPISPNNDHVSKITQKRKKKSGNDKNVRNIKIETKLCSVPGTTGARKERVGGTKR